jgi:excisionase family DNA binding protein
MVCGKLNLRMLTCGKATDQVNGKIREDSGPQAAYGQPPSDHTRATWPLSQSRVDERMKTVFTTGEAAKICKVSQQTIIRCFDNGQLKGFRVPGSRFRRIPREALYKFMKDNGIPTDALESGKRKVLLVDDDAELVELIQKVLDEDGRFDVKVARNGFDAGMMVREYRPDLIVLDVMLPDINGKEVCHRVRADPTLEDVRILCISGMVEEDKIQELKLSGADDFLHKPFDIEELIDRMCGQLDIEPAPTTA